MASEKRHMEYSIWSLFDAIWSTPCGHYFLPYGVLHVVTIFCHMEYSMWSFWSSYSHVSIHKLHIDVFITFMCISCIIRFWQWYITWCFVFTFSIKIISRILRMSYLMSCEFFSGKNGSTHQPPHIYCTFVFTFIYILSTLQHKISRIYQTEMQEESLEELLFSLAQA